ncbi:hypothetical protein GCM10008111_28430 [Alishewanella tabrizica]|uniref:Transposase n=1 Tax=Alishewanella tabrizica TaxID=671278 RepID=A0ABQ2WRZ1_9ALTE|nr:hypothetical protein GCM10008111_28430 [Alishewanella tabrizica]
MSFKKVIFQAGKRAYFRHASCKVKFRVQVMLQIIAEHISGELGIPVLRKERV